MMHCESCGAVFEDAVETLVRENLDGAAYGCTA